MANATVTASPSEVVGATLTVQGMTVRFGGITALDEANFEVRSGEISGLIGPNGAGKTTMFNCLTGIYRFDSGSVKLDGREIGGMMPNQIADLAVSRTFQNLALFPTLKVRENVAVGLHRVRKSGWVSNALRLPNVLSEEKRVRDRSIEALEEVGLAHLAEKPCAGQPYGILKRIELARAIASSPRLLLLDEPAAGLAHGEVDDLMDVIRKIRDVHGLTVCLVEHHMGLVMNLCEHITVLNLGRTIATGTPLDVANNEDVITAYLGASDS